MAVGAKEDTTAWCATFVWRICCACACCACVTWCWWRFCTMVCGEATTLAAVEWVTIVLTLEIPCAKAEVVWRLTGVVGRAGNEKMR